MSSNHSDSAVSTSHTLRYQTGFANEFSSEVLPGALPKTKIHRKNAAYGLYAEQISGTAFTAPRHSNRRSWLYRIRPAAMHQPFVQIGNRQMTNQFDETPSSPNQLRWDPLPMPAEATDFIEGWHTMAGTGSADAQTGCAIHLFAANKDMTDRFFYDADAEILIIPQQGRLHIKTELGILEIEPQEIAVIPRGIRFRSACLMAVRVVMSVKILG